MSLVNVFGIIDSVDSDMKQFGRENGRSIYIRNFSLSDSSGYSIAVALWGVEAEHCDLKVGNLIEIRNTKITNYDQLSLSKLKASTIKDISSMDMEEVNKLKDISKRNIGETSNKTCSLSKKF